MSDRLTCWQTYW